MQIWSKHTSCNYVALSQYRIPGMEDHNNQRRLSRQHINVIRGNILTLYVTYQGALHLPGIDDIPPIDGGGGGGARDEGAIGVGGC